MTERVTRAERDADVAAMGAGMQGADRGLLLGYGPEEETLTEIRYEGRGGFTVAGVERETAPAPIFSSDLAPVLSQLGPEDQALLALDMFAVGVYENINYMFDDDLQLDQEYFTSMVNKTVGLAAQSAEFGLDTDFLDVLLRNTDRSAAELTALLAEKKAEARAGGGGRVINYIDPVALVDAVKKASSSVTGRMATPEEQQAFVKTIHGLQASGATGISVGARAEAFAREQAPEEAAAMDYAGAAGLVMQALGIRQ